jgi:hypothetical protein
MAGLFPAIPNHSLSQIIGIAGTSPAMTPEFSQLLAPLSKPSTCADFVLLAYTAAV